MRPKLEEIKQEMHDRVWKIKFSFVLQNNIDTEPELVKFIVKIIIYCFMLSITISLLGYTW